jgi:hypothetical protein
MSLKSVLVLDRAESVIKLPFSSELWKQGSMT